MREIYNKICIALKRQYIFRLCASLKQTTQNFIKRFERKPLNLDFNMENFFTEMGRVRENRQRLRELYDQYKRIENYYPLFLAYITAFGIFIFDLIAFGINYYELYYYNFITLLTVSSFVYACCLIWKVLKGNNWTHDYLPKDVCEEYDSDVFKDFPELKKGTTEFNNEITRRYRIALDKFVLKNFKTYENKTNRLGNVWKPLIISLILLSINITAYKTIEMKKLNEEPEERITTESVDQKTQKEILNEIIEMCKAQKDFDDFERLKKNTLGNK